MITNYKDGREYVLDLLKKPSERDKQRQIGASLFGSPCTRCVAKYLTDHRNEPNRWWLGARIGTAVHETLEHEILERHPKAMSEHKVTIGELEGYGVIGSTLDWYLDGICRDFKTSTREKIKWYKLAVNTEPSETELSVLSAARFTLQQYYGQLTSYALGLLNEGLPVHTLSLVFIARDGLTDDDVWGVDFEFDEDYAQQVWKRLEDLWKFVREGGNYEELKAHPECFCQRY